MADQPEALFYHLERHPLDRVLPQLLERTLERGWRAVIQAGSPERVAALDQLLWTYKEESFLPHGTAVDGHAERQPIFLTAELDNPNNASVRFIVEGATASDHVSYKRLVFMFDGRDPDAVARARKEWKIAKDAGCAVTYWQQTPQGKWERKA